MSLIIYKVVRPIKCTPMQGNPYWIKNKLAKLGKIDSNDFTLKNVKNEAEKFLMADLSDLDFVIDEKWSPEDCVIQEKEGQKPLYIVRCEEIIPF